MIDIAAVSSMLSSLLAALSTPWVFLLAITLNLVALLLLRRKSAARPMAAVTSSLPTPAQTLALIRNRRSIFPKDYTGERLSDEDVQTLLEAANWAPTHGKTEPWRWVVLSTAEAQRQMVDVVRRVSEANLKPGGELDKRRAKMQAMLEQKLPKASHLVMICCRRAPNAQGKMMPEWEDQCAVAAAVQNLHLMATSMNIAGYWSSFPAEDVRADSLFKTALGWAEADIPMGVFWLARSNALDSYRAKRGSVSNKTSWQT